MDEIDYFPKRDKFKTQKDVGSDWEKLKELKISKTNKAKAPQPPPTPSKEKNK